MRNILAGWTPVLLLIGAVRSVTGTEGCVANTAQVTADARLDIYKAVGGQGVQVRRFENSVSGVIREETVSEGQLNARSVESTDVQSNVDLASPAGVAHKSDLDVNSILSGVAQGQQQGQNVELVGSGDVRSGDVGGDLANQIAGGGAPSIDQILNGLGQQSGSKTSNLTRSQEQGQAASGLGSSASKEGQTGLQGQGVAGGQANQGSDGNLRTIQIVSTIISDPNGLQHATNIVLDLGGGQAQTTAPASTLLAKAPQGGSPVRSTSPATSKAAHTVQSVLSSKSAVNLLGGGNSTVRLIHCV